MKYMFLFICSIIYSQHTERFLNLTNSIKPIDSITINSTYNNGNIKETGLIKVYQQGDYLYEFYSGKITNYYKNGIVKSIEVYDSFGNLIESQLFDFEGILYCDKKTLKIDTKASSISEFITYDRHLIILTHLKRYRFSLIPAKWFLLEEGDVLNGRKTGVWKKYHKDGTLKKIIDY